MGMLMRRILFGAFTMGILFSGLALKPVFGAEYPQVAGLKPFSMETNLMSLPGYLRYLTFVQSGVWISRSEAVAVESEQEGNAINY